MIFDMDSMFELAHAKEYLLHLSHWVHDRGNTVYWHRTKTRVRSESLLRPRFRGFLVRTVTIQFRMGSCPGWHESSLDAQAILLA